MISAPDFVQALKDKGFLRYTGVPCSFFQAAVNRVLDDPKLLYTMVPNEGAALALASGAALAGKPTVLLIQNSGFGNLINPLTSLSLIYHIPVLIFMSGRAYGVEDEPQHEIIGKTMKPILEALNVPCAEMPDTLGEFKKSLEEALKILENQKTPFVFLVRKNTIDEYTTECRDKTVYPLKRIQAIEIISQTLTGDEAVIATTGKPSRELFAVCDRPNHFYMQGSMGHAASIGLGVALAQPHKKVVVLDGDGAILMHLGILSSIGYYQPENLLHIVLDNEAYETTGNQDTTSSRTNLTQAAQACGYKTCAEVQTGDELKEKLAVLLKHKGPHFLRIKINRVATASIPRISSKHSSKKIAENFKEAILNS
jgi:phosphonopyruvate decarboxylase